MSQQEPIPGKWYLTRIDLRFFKQAREYNKTNIEGSVLKYNTKFLYLSKNPLDDSDHKVLVDGKIRYLGLKSFFTYVTELE